MSPEPPVQRTAKALRFAEKNAFPERRAFFIPGQGGSALRFFHFFPNTVIFTPVSIT